MTQNPKLGAVLCVCLAIGILIPAGPAEAGMWGYWLHDPVLGVSPLDSTFRAHVPESWLLSRVGPGGQLGPPRRDPAISFEPHSDQVRETYSEGGVEVRPPILASVGDYNNIVSRRTYRRLWRDHAKATRSVQRGTVKKPTGLFHVELPFQVPKQLRSIVGSGTPNIDVSGSETITLSGVSDWTVRPKGTGFDTERQRQSAFPSLEMKQDLQVNLTGSIGDKIKVDVDQSSNVQTNIGDNKVKLRYEGDEDDMIKSVDLGNTNLSLQGASIRQDGLFGIKTVAKLGNVDVVAIASKQEGKSETSRFTPSGEKRQVKISDLDYIKRQYFFISDHPMEWDRASLKVYRDDAITSNNNGLWPGLARLRPDSIVSGTNPERAGIFDDLKPGDDYQLMFPYLVTGGPTGQEIPVIKLRYPLGPNEILAVTYVEKNGTSDVPIGNDVLSDVDPVLGKEANQYLLKMIKPPIEDFTVIEGGRFDPAGPWFPVLGYEMRNFYDLTARNIALETLDLKVRQRNSGLSVDPDAVNGTALVEALGLDVIGTGGVTGADGKIDDRFIVADEGILFFPDLHPFDPDENTAPPGILGGCGPGHGGFLCLDDFGRNVLATDTTLVNPNVYYTKTPDLGNQSRYYIDAQFKSSQQGYFIGRFNILENSEQVKVDGVLQQKGKDYFIDYDTGQVNFTRAPGPEQVITVDYSFAPGIGQVQRTLLGFSTSYNPSADLSVTSSILYESRGAQELNPKLGEEPARSMVGDLASVLTFRPSWMTEFVNLIPGVHTTAPSTLNLQGNVAMSLPNPNTEGEAYVDDMEGNRESNTLALSRISWMWSGIPVDAAQQPISLLLTEHARLEWYNARGVKERDLKPILTNEEGGDNERAVIEMNVLNPNSSSAWTGLTQSMSRNGEDFSRTRFIEIWVNDRVQDHSATSAKLHIDFGRVSEDAFWQTDSIPNHKLDTEDKNGDTKLDFDEDTGLDAVPDLLEPGYVDPDNKDPRGDDYFYSLSDSKNYSKINGTEGNSFGDPNARPDTEDLDLDGRLDEDNAYFEATIDLSDTAYVGVDVALDYAGNPNVKLDNGWRLFRIPLDSPAFQAFGRPSWDDIKHARIWLDGMVGPTNIQVGGIEMVGSRWLATPLPDSLKFRGVEFDVKVRNNKDDAAIYEAPFEVEKAVGGNAIRREQSLALSFSRLLNGDSVFSFKTFGDNGSGVGYTQYRNIRFYVHGDPGVEAQNVRVIARFGADTVNYYEYSLPARSGWQDVRIPMEILSRLKESSIDRVKVDSLQGADIGARYTVVGNPSFTRVSRITFGLTVLGGATEAAGEVWIDELRLSDVRKESGKMGNLAMQATFADVVSLNASYQKQDQDFFRVGSGVNRGSGLNHTALGFSSTFFLDRMMPQSGVQLPVRVSVQHSSDVPKYRTGSDVVLDAARSEIETRRSDLQSIDVAYSRTGARKGLAKWTIDAMKGSMAYSRSANISPQSADSSWVFTANGGYNIPIGGGKGIPLSKSIRLKYLPELVTLTAGWSASRRTSYARFIQGLTDSSALRSNTLSRDLSLGQRTTYTPVSGLTTSFSIDSRRNMLFRQEGLFGFNKGTEVDHRQGADLSWTPRRVLFLNPNISLTGSYHEDARPELRISQNDPLGLKNIENRASARVTNTFPLSRLSHRFQRPASRGDSSSANPLTAPLRFVLSRLQDVQTTFSFARASSATRVGGNPGFAYKSGFTQRFDPSILRASNSNISRSRSFISTANTTFKALPHVSVDVRADHQLTFTDAYLGARRDVILSWPDLNGRWLQLQEDLGLQDALSSLIVSSHYSLRREDRGPQGKPIETRGRTTTWAPLLGWQASFKNGVRAEVNSATSTTSNLDERQGGVLRERTTSNHDIRLTKTYLASKGIRFPWSKRRVKLPNDLNLNLTMGIQRERSVTERPGFEPLSDSDLQRLTVGSGTSYNFTPSVTGGFDLGFRQTRDYKSNVTQRGITIAVNAQFRF